MAVFETLYNAPSAQVTVGDSFVTVYGPDEWTTAFLHHSRGIFWSITGADKYGIRGTRFAVPDDFGTLRSVPCPHVGYQN